MNMYSLNRAETNSAYVSSVEGINKSIYECKKLQTFIQDSMISLKYLMLICVDNGLNQGGSCCTGSDVTMLPWWEQFGNER